MRIRCQIIILRVSKTQTLTKLDNFKRYNFKRGLSFRGLSFRGLSFRGLTFRALNFRGLSFRGLSFRDTLLRVLKTQTLTKLNNFKRFFAPNFNRAFGQNMEVRCK